ncbi:uncharacterized protein E0L32_007454 [Thyridium curvatum]|uniref:DUF1907 domain-containing protein n=1 Tax=Thyridium curvatum TaxID=1093900 RepID=A0A507AYU6_9PEZI|nr:uncharacterized protein E0L32_007454 [Thyridium curvatum]TPX11956.1 hypothetical protein E0L32_007454 [Thyridium curvatum]
MMQSQKFTLSPPSLEELAKALQAPLAANFEQSAVSVVPCPDLREAPFGLATAGLSGDEKVADVGGQPNLFPRPRLGAIWSMTDIARAMEMDPGRGGLLGAGAGPFHVVGQNCELAPNLSWRDGLDNVDNRTRYVEIDCANGAVHVAQSSSVDCALMVNLFGSSGDPGPVLKITAKRRKGAEKSFAECIRKGLHAAYGDSQTISLGGVFLVKSGRATYHVMPDFPSEAELPFKDRGEVDKWLTYHDFDGPIMCLSVLHSSDPGKAMGLRMEHTHCYSTTGAQTGGHYHYEAEEGGEYIEYEGYFNTAKAIYRVDRP